MSQGIVRGIFVFAAALASVSSAVAQPSASTQSDATANNSWGMAQSLSSSDRNLFVITMDQPDRRQRCHVQSFTPEHLICSRPGGSRTYLREQVEALILPGDGHLKLEVMLSLNAAMGAAIWGTVVLAAPCPPCAVATGIAALLFFGAAGAIAMGDERPDRLLYLASGRQLSQKFRHVESLSTT